MSSVGLSYQTFRFVLRIYSVVLKQFLSVNDCNYIWSHIAQNVRIMSMFLKISWYNMPPSPSDYLNKHLASFYCWLFDSRIHATHSWCWLSLLYYICTVQAPLTSCSLQNIVWSDHSNVRCLSPLLFDLQNLVTFSESDSTRSQLRSSTTRSAVTVRMMTKLGGCAFYISGHLYGTVYHLNFCSSTVDVHFADGWSPNFFNLLLTNSFYLLLY